MWKNVWNLSGTWTKTSEERHGKSENNKLQSGENRMTVQFTYLGMVPRLVNTNLSF